MSGSIPHANIAAQGPLTRGDFLMLLFWFADTRAVPEVVGIRGLSRLTRLALIFGEETGLGREIKPFFTFHPTPKGGIASPEVWSELLALRAYQVVAPQPADEIPPPEELDERRWMLETQIPPHEHGDYPLPTFFERDVLTNKGTFFAAKREDQMIERRVRGIQGVVAANALSLSALTERARPLLRVPAGR